ncbi:MAG: LamG domain-containing protein [Rhodospirillaceae bacterium]
MRNFLKRCTRAFARDEGVAGIVIAIIVSILAFSALSVFMSKFAGPTRDVPRAQTTAVHASLVQSALLAYLNVNATLPCPDTDATPDGQSDSCNATGTTAGTLPWRTIGLSRDDALDGYGTFYSYVVSAEAKDVCLSVGSDFDSNVAPTYTGELLNSDELEVRLTTQAAGEGTYVPFVVFSHGPNKLGGISASGAAYSAPFAGSDEEDNAGATPAVIFSGPYDVTQGSDYFDDVVFTPTASKLQSQCEGNTPSGLANAEIYEPFTNGIDSAKLESSPTGAPTEATDSAGNAVASLSTTASYFISAASFRLDASEKPLYIATDWVPDPDSTSATPTAVGFSIITRAAGVPTGDVLAQGITFRVSGNVDADGEAGTIDILDNGTSLSPTVVGAATFQIRSARKYLIEVYDSGNSVWMKIEQDDDPDNSAYAYVDTGDVDNTGDQRVYFVNGANLESHIDNLVVGTPMLAMDTYGTGYAHAGTGVNGTSSGAFTIEGWFKPRELPGAGEEATLIAKWNANSLANSSFRLFMTEDGALSLSVGSGTAAIDTASLEESLVAGEWTHVAVSYDAGDVVLYINSKAVTRLTDVLSSAAIRAPNARFAVGATYNSASGGSYEDIYNGAVSDVRVWDVARSSFEILEWYNHRLPQVNSAAAVANLIVNWRFDRESGDFTSTTVVRTPNMPGGTDANGTFGGAAAYVVTRLLDFRTVSTDICGPGVISVAGNRIGPYRCDFRGAETGTITAEHLGGIATFYAKVWGPGGGSDTDGTGITIWDGGGGGFAGGLFLNNGSDLDITAGTGGTGGATSGNGVTSFADQGTPRLQGTRGTRAANNGDGASGGATATSMLTSELDSSTTRGRIPGCIPAITVLGDACTDPYFALSSGDTTLYPHFGYGGDADGGGLYINGQDGLVVLFW